MKRAILQTPPPLTGGAGARRREAASTLKAALRQALAGSSSQQPVDTGKLYLYGPRAQVEAALQELYDAREVGCCKITRRGVTSIVWWQTGSGRELPRYGTGIPGMRNGKRGAE